ncbi:MAG: acyl-CoA dehydrogenase family protein [Alphaproteobacteria bacterium]|nr:acyl-CoA dehydrogenase family protein [Alphaproteobacteria bacterium]MCB9928626.1 acyl-CoA dehydrogenase family protein [Alphaproteobacteria bacterium]
MAHEFRFDSMPFTPELEAFRMEVREFLHREIAAGTFTPGDTDKEAGYNPEFSRKVGERGWLGMTWPKAYGGHGRSHLERYVMTEEMLAMRAPVRFHWVADRQSGPVLLKYGQEEVRKEIVPKIAAGELCFCIGLSEPNSGSDLFAASTRATKTDGGWLVNGRKIWTSNAHRSHYMIALVRTSPSTQENRRHGLTQFLIKMDENGPQPRPIINLTGAHEFNEVVFDDVFVPDSHVIGRVDEAWKQATDELAYERSGPDRWTETIFSLIELTRVAEARADDRISAGLGREVAHLKTLRRMSASIAGMLQDGQSPVAEAAVVKDLGTNWEQALPNTVRLLAPKAAQAMAGNRARFEDVQRLNTLIAPKLTIQGGTREVLRGIIARGLGLR